MAIASIESLPRWDTAETIQKLSELQDQKIDLRNVLEQFSPDHVHGPWQDQPLWIRELYSVLSDQESESRTKLAERMFVRHLRTRGIYAEKVLFHCRMRGIPFRDQLVILGDLKEPTPWSVRETLKYPLVDFFVYFDQPSDRPDDFATINTTRIKGNGDIYQVYVKHSSNVILSDAIEGRSQGLISKMLEARV